jgi:hypothetical protein
MLFMCTTFVSELKQKRNGTGSGNKRESNLEKKGAKLKGLCGFYCSGVKTSKLF